MTGLKQFCSDRRPNENEIVIVLKKFINIAHHIFSLSLPLWALLRCLRRSFLCTADRHGPSSAFCSPQSIVLTISLPAVLVTSRWAGFFWFCHDLNRPIRLTQCCTLFKSSGFKRFFVYCIWIIMWHSHLKDMKFPETKRFIPKGFELGTN